MRVAYAEVQGTLRPDGTLVLDEMPNVPPGRVRVVVEPIPLLPPGDLFWDSMHALWEGQKIRGHVPRTREEIDSELGELDAEADAELSAVERLQEASRPPEAGPRGDVS